MRLGAAAVLRGAPAVAETFKGRAQAARPALVDGEFGLVVSIDGMLRVVLLLAFADNQISAIDAVADPEHLGGMNYVYLEE
jgi:RNA polymerase sigma-70 factor (ECF subfamily)